MIRAYLRVSTKGQADNNGLPAQKSAIEKWAAANYPGTPIKFYEDAGVSGVIPMRGRPGAAQMLEDCTRDCNEDNHIVAFSVSRFSRMVWISSQFLFDMKCCGVTVSALDAPLASESPSQAFMFHILASVSQQDRENILKITEAGREEKRKVGGDLGGTVQPWQKREGKGKDAQIVNDPEKIQKILEVRRLLSYGWAYKDISKSVGVSAGTISNWKKQIYDLSSEMNKAL